MTKSNSILKRIFLSPPHMGDEELSFIKHAFASNYVAPLGPMVDAFEQEFAEKVGVRNAVAVASGIAAMPRWNGSTPVKWTSPPVKYGSHFTGQALHGVKIEG